MRLDESTDGAPAVERIEQLDEAFDLEAFRADPARPRSAQPQPAVLRDPAIGDIVRQRHRSRSEDLERVEVEGKRLARVLAAGVPGEAALVPRADVDDLGPALAREEENHLARLQ